MSDAPRTEPPSVLDRPAESPIDDTLKSFSKAVKRAVFALGVDLLAEISASLQDGKKDDFTLHLNGGKVVAWSQTRHRVKTGRAQ